MYDIERVQFGNKVFTLHSNVRGERKNGTVFIGEITSIRMTDVKGRDAIFVDDAFAGYVGTNIPDDDFNIVSMG